MLKSKLGIIIQREYTQRVHKKSFLLTTLLMPLGIVLMGLIPTLILLLNDSSADRVMVVDPSGRVVTGLADSESVQYIASADIDVDSALRRDDVDAVLVLPANIIDAPKSTARLYSNGTPSMSLEMAITTAVNHVVETERLKDYDIENLDAILKAVESNVALTAINRDDDVEEVVSGMGSMAMGMVMEFIMYMFVLVYGSQVMSSIIEEKGNRVLDLMVTSVRPMDMMLGKILGVALVALTQLALWGAIILVMSGLVIPALVPEGMMEQLAADVQAQPPSGDEALLLSALGMMTNVGQMFTMVLLTTLYVILGFLMYSAVYAAVGSAVDSMQDASQLSILCTLPVILGFVLSTVAAQEPMSQLSVWGALFPITAPMVGIVRLPYGVPAWQTALSLAGIFLAFLVLVWLAGKIYRVGILMHGKKPTVRELVRWINYK